MLTEKLSEQSQTINLLTARLDAKKIISADDEYSSADVHFRELMQTENTTKKKPNFPKASGPTKGYIKNRFNVLSQNDENTDSKLETITLNEYPTKNKKKPSQV